MGVVFWLNENPIVESFLKQSEGSKIYENREDKWIWKGKDNRLYLDKSNKKWRHEIVTLL